MTFAERLKALRKKRGISIYRLAKDINVAYSAARSWETGERMPREHSFNKLVNYYGCDPSWLRYNKQEKFSPAVMAAARKIERYIKQHPSETKKIMTIIEVLTKI